MNKKILFVFVLLLVVSFGATAFASLTFTTDAITGTTDSTIDLGTGNTLYLNTISNAPVTLGTGLFTAPGGISSTLFTGPVTALKSATTSINVSSATAPINGQVLTATGGTAATWQTPSGGGVFEGGTNSIGVGSTALNRTTPGFNNVAVGPSTLISVTVNSDSNTAVGASALNRNTDGMFNTGIGEEALYFNSTGGNNTALGFMALMTNTTASNSTAVGHQSLKASTGASNTAIGYRALYHNTTGTLNVAIGQQAGETTISANNNLTGSNNTWVGYNTGPSVNGTSTPISNASAFGNGAFNSASNQVTLGNASVTDVMAGGPTGLATVNAGKYKLSALNTAPASATATGTTGEIRVTADAIYVCIATNTWVKAALATW